MTIVTSNATCEQIKDAISVEVHRVAVLYKQEIFDDRMVCDVRNYILDRAQALDALVATDIELNSRVVLNMSNSVIARYNRNEIPRSAIVNFRSALIRTASDLGSLIHINDNYRSLEYLFTSVDSGRFFNALVGAAQAIQNDDDLRVVNHDQKA